MAASWKSGRSHRARGAFRLGLSSRKLTAAVSVSAACPGGGRCTAACPRDAVVRRVRLRRRHGGAAAGRLAASGRSRADGKSRRPAGRVGRSDPSFPQGGIMHSVVFVVLAQRGRRPSRARIGRGGEGVNGPHASEGDDRGDRPLAAGRAAGRLARAPRSRRYAQPWSAGQPRPACRDCSCAYQSRG